MKSRIIERAKEGKFVLIAEIGVNYYDIADKLNITPMEAAKLMVREAKEAGIHAVKFQTYKAETLAAKDSHLIGIHQKRQLHPNMNYLKSLIVSLTMNTQSYLDIVMT